MGGGAVGVRAGAADQSLVDQFTISVLQVYSFVYNGI
jgi:hypothetical protein